MTLANVRISLKDTTDMPTFRGRFTTIGSQSFLNQDLLLMAGVAEPAAAIIAATQFLLQIRQLRPSEIIDVDGQTGGVGSVRIIILTDARRAPVDSVRMSINAMRLRPEVQSAKIDANAVKKKGRLRTGSAAKPK